MDDASVLLVHLRKLDLLPRAPETKERRKRIQTLKKNTAEQNSMNIDEPEKLESGNVV